MSVTFVESFPIGHATDDLWRHLRDIHFVADCLPGATLTEEHEDGSYEGELAMKLGPTRAVFAGTLQLDLDDGARAGRLTAKGGDRRRTKAAANGTIRVEEATPGSVLHLDIAIDIAGPLSQFAQTGGREVTRQLLLEFVSNVEAGLTSVEVDEVASAEDDGGVTTPAGPAPPTSAAPATQRTDSIKVGRLLVRSLVAWLRRMLVTAARWVRARVRKDTR